MDEIDERIEKIERFPENESLSLVIVSHAHEQQTEVQ